MPAINFKSQKRRRKGAPDDILHIGPIVLARYGRLIVAKNLATPKEFQKIEEEIPKTYAKLNETIATEIGALRSLLAPLDPVKFLSEAFAQRFAAHLGFEDEPSLTFDDHTVPARMIDYCQSLFASMPSSKEVRSHTNEEFHQAREHTRKLFRAAQQYIALSSHPTITGKDHNALAELISKLTYYWVFVRSDRHAYFEMPHHRDLFTPIDSILRRVLAVTSEELLDGLEKLLANAQSGIGDAGIALVEIFEAASNHPDFEKLVASDSDYDYDVTDLANLANRPVAEIEDALRSFAGTKLFEVKEATRWPDHLIELLSNRLGDAADFLQPSERAAWPTRVWPIFQRPFLRVGTESYCFDHIAFCDRFYRQVIGDQERASLQSVRKEQEERDFASISGKIGRNETCPCGSGLKYKRCHGR